MSNEKKRTNMQSLHGKLCVSLYEELGDTVLPVIRKTYGEYGREIGSGLKRKTGVSGLQDAVRSFVRMCNDGGLKVEVEIDGDTARVTGYGCPFCLENTRPEVCHAMMEMDLEMLKTLSGTENIEMRIEETVAAGDPVCRITYRKG